MNEETGQDLPEMTRIEERLRMERTAATGLELDQLKLRALSQARSTKPAKRTKGQLMKSRLVLVSMMVLGLMMSTTGATLAISGSSGEGSSAAGNYREAPGDNVLGDIDEGETTPDGAQGDEPSGSDDAGDVGGVSDTQDTQQVAATGSGEDSLPFTGFLAIPLLIGGVALLGSGAALRWRAKD